MSIGESVFEYGSTGSGFGCRPAKAKHGTSEIGNDGHMEATDLVTSKVGNRTTEKGGYIQISNLVQRQLAVHAL